jgi:hypothetical protein
MPDPVTIVDLRKQPHAAALPISGGQGVAGSSPAGDTVVPIASNGSWIYASVVVIWIIRRRDGHAQCSTDPIVVLSATHITLQRG